MNKFNPNLLNSCVVLIVYNKIHAPHVITVESYDQAEAVAHEEMRIDGNVEKIDIYGLTGHLRGSIIRV